MNKVKSSKATTKRLVASGIMLFGGLLTFTSKPQDVHAEDGAAPVKETNTMAAESSNVTVLKSSVKPTSESGAKVNTSGEGAEVKQVPSDGVSTGAATATETSIVAERPATVALATPVATPAPTAGTTSKIEEMSKTITLKGKQYILNGKAVSSFYYPMFYNTFTNVATGREFTYSFIDGSSTTSAYYMRDESGKYKVLTGEHAGVDITKITIEKTADSLSKTFTTYDDSVQVKETLTFGDAGLFEHTVTVKNLTDTDMNNVSFGVMLDTELDGDGNNVALHASGDGGAFFWNDVITFFANGSKDVNVYVGKFAGSMNDIAERQQVPGIYKEDVVKGKNSALQYETGKVNLGAGSSHTFKFSERVRPGRHALGKLTVRYVDTEGNVIHPEQVLQDIVGESYTITPLTINGYTFQESYNGLTGTYSIAPEFFTLTYKKNSSSTLPDTEDPKVPAKPVTPVKPTTPVKPATPTQKMPDPAPIVATQANKVLPQTGEKVSSAVSAIGVGILATLSLFGFVKLHKQKNF